MDNSMRNAEALNKRLDEICDKVMDSHAKTIAKAEIDEQTQTDYASTAQNEMAIAEEANALVCSFTASAFCPYFSSNPH